MYYHSSKTTFIGKKVEYLSSCHSTNDIAADKVRSGQYLPGEIIITDEQLSGRGQRGRSWETEKGANLTFSLILQPSFLKATEQFLLSQAIALGLWHYLSARTAGVGIKWPNDLLIHSRKVAGILIENTLRGSRLQVAVVGIGVNINQVDFENPRATSFSQALQTKLDCHSEFEQLLGALEVFYKLLEKREFGTIREKYLQCLAGYGQERFFTHGQETFRALITGVSETGRLQLQTPAGPAEFGIQELTWHWDD